MFLLRVAVPHWDSVPPYSGWKCKTRVSSTLLMEPADEVDILMTVHRDVWYSYNKTFLIPLASSQHNLYDLYSVHCYTTDDGQRNCPKHVEFYCKNKFEKLVHLVGFIVRMMMDRETVRNT